MRKILEAFLGNVKEGVYPREIALAMALGVFAGFVTGWNLTLVTVLFAVVLLRAPFQMFAQAWAASTMVSWMMTPVIFRMGRWVLEESPLSGMLAASADGLFVVLFDLDRYTLTGGIVWGFMLALPCAWLAYRFAHSLQAKLRTVGEAIKDSRWTLQFICWLTFGSLEGVLKEPKPRRMLRPFGVIATCVILIPMCGMAWMFGPGMIERSVMHTLSLANQAEVSADDFELSFTDGSLQIRNLQIADAGQLDHDRMRVGSLTAVLKPAPLLRGRVHIEKILIDGIACDVPRDKPARAYEVNLPDFDIDADLNFEGLEDAAYQVEAYARNWIEIKDRMTQVQDMVRRVEELVHKDDEQADDALKLPAEYVAMREMHCDFGSPRPTVLVELIRAKHLAPKWGLGDRAMLEVTNLNSEPELMGRPTKIEIAVPDHSVECLAMLNYHIGAPHSMRVKFSGVSLAELVNLDKLPSMIVSGGMLTFVGEGTFDGDHLDLPMTVRADRLAMSLPGGERRLGLPSELWNQGLAQLRGMELNARLYGQWESPRMHVDTDQLVAQFRNQLHAAGHAMLASAVDRQVQYGQQWIQEQADAQLARGMEYLDQGTAAANDALQTGRDATGELADSVNGQLDRAQQEINNTQNRVNNQIQDSVNRALGGLQDQQDLANQFLRNRFGGDNPLTEAASNVIQGAAGNARQGLNHANTNAGGVVDTAGNAARDTVGQAQRTTANAQATTDGGFNAAQGVTNTANNAGRTAGNGLAEQADRYANQLGNSANDAVRQFGPATVSGGGDAGTTPNRYSNQSSNRYELANQGGAMNSAGQGQGAFDAAATQGAGAQRGATSPPDQLIAGANQRQPGEPAPLLYPEAMRSATQLAPNGQVARGGRYEQMMNGHVVQTADRNRPAGASANRSNEGTRYAPVGTQDNAQPTAYPRAHSLNAAAGEADRYANGGQYSFGGNGSTGPATNRTGREIDFSTSPRGGQNQNPQSQNPQPQNPQPRYSPRNTSSGSGAQFGSVDDVMQEIGGRSTANVPAGSRNAIDPDRYATSSGNRPAAVTPQMASSSMASDDGQPASARVGAGQAAGVAPPVGFRQGYSQQPSMTEAEYRAAMLMQQQMQQPAPAGVAGVAGVADVGQAGVSQIAEQPRSSWNTLADNVTGSVASGARGISNGAKNLASGARKLWPFGRSDSEPQTSASVGDGMASAGYASSYAGGGATTPGYGVAQQQQQQAYHPHQTGQQQIQQAEASEPWYRRLFRR